MSDHHIHGDLQFGPFELSGRERMLRREGVVLSLGGRALDILIYLAERSGEVIAKRELIDYVWSGVTVEEGSLRVHVAAIRKALGDGQFGNRYIANIKGRGYAFVCTVVPLAGNSGNRNAKFLYQGRPSVRPLTIFGRDTAVNGASDKLRDERFVTSPDSGGIGKMAVAVGHAAAAEAGWNVCFADTESLADPCRIAGDVSSAMEVTLSPKRVKNRTRGRKLDRSKAKPGIARVRKTRADLEQELKTCRRGIADAGKRLAEAAMQQTATSEMLRLISNSPIQSVLDAVAEHAARLCHASNARIWRLEDNLLRLVASYGESSATMDGRGGLPADRDTVTGRAACDRRTIHVRDIAAEASEYPVGSRIVQGEGWHTTLATPLLREGMPIGVILVRRMEVRPFHDQQISLLETFAGQAAIAIENARLYNDLQEREARIRRLVDSNIIGIYIGDSRGRIIEANDAVLEMLGYGHDDVTSGRMRWTKLTPAEWSRSDADALAQLGMTGTCRPYEKEYYRKDGSRVPVLVGGAFFERKTDEGVVFVIDMSDHKRAKEALRESEAKIRRLVDSNIIGIFIWDFDGRILEANDEFLRMVGYDRADLLAESIWWTDLTPPDWRDRNNARIEQQKGGGRFEPFEKEFTRKDGSRVPVLIGGATFEKGGNQGVAFVLDLTGRKRVEAEARESERRYREAQQELAHANRVATMGQLTSSIAHEVNQPITAAVTYALAARRFLSAEPPNFREVDDALSLIVKEGNRAGDVVGRIRALVKKAPARKDAVAINDAILEVIALTRTEAADNSVAVRTQLAEGLPRVQGDRVQLQQVLLNLIVNAIEAMRDVGEKERELLISTRNEPDGVSVEVRDSGPGFTPAVLDRVFEAFYTTKPGGLGLGLSICRSIIEAHNGRLSASANVPRGAIFRFIAPVHPAAVS
jgi:PAS domain S-box-containing protein